MEDRVDMLAVYQRRPVRRRCSVLTGFGADQDARVVTPGGAVIRTGISAPETSLAPGQAWEGRTEHAVDRTGNPL